MKLYVRTIYPRKSYTIIHYKKVRQVFEKEIRSPRGNYVIENKLRIIDLNLVYSKLISITFLFEVLYFESRPFYCHVIATPGYDVNHPNSRRRRVWTLIPAEWVIFKKRMTQ